MAERMVPIYVNKNTRDKIIKKKQALTYDEYFNGMMRNEK